MGTGRDKKKKAKEKKGEVTHGRGERKLAHKADLAQSKNARRQQRQLGGGADGDEDDLDALLARARLDDAQRLEPSVERGCAAPSARVHATWLARGADVLLYGGECVEPVSGKVRVFGDLYLFHTQSERWDRISPPAPRPPPRCAHASWLHRSCLYVWGGEFSSPNQERFRHYRDLWRLDLLTWRWDQLPTKGGGPSPRSGHRAVVHGGAAFLFGGFFDTGRSDEVRYHSDLWRLDLETLTWASLGDASTHGALGGGGFGGGGFGGGGGGASSAAAAAAAAPSSSSSWPGARSGCQMVVCGDMALMHGGYRKSRDDDDADLEHGCALDDTWVLDLRAAAAAAGAEVAPAAPAAAAAAAAAATGASGGKKGGGKKGGTAATATEQRQKQAPATSSTAAGPIWERVRKQGMAPGPRASFAMAGPVRGRVFLFGGVADRERRGGEDLSSEFFNDLYGFVVDRRRWFAAEVVAKQGAPADDRAGAVVAAEEAAARRAAAAEEASAAAAEAAATAAAAAAAASGREGAPASTALGSSNSTTPAPNEANAAAKPLPPGVSAEAAARFAAAARDPSHPLSRAAARIQALYRGHVVRKALRVYRLGGAVSEILYSPAAFTLDFKSARGPRPRARINAMAALVAPSALWLLGGAVEVGSGGDREVTLDDLWRLDLARLDGWRLVRANTAGEEAFGGGGSGSGWEEASGGEEDEDEEDDSEG